MPAVGNPVACTGGMLKGTDNICYSIDPCCFLLGKLKINQIRSVHKFWPIEVYQFYTASVLWPMLGLSCLVKSFVEQMIFFCIFWISVAVELFSFIY